MGISQSSVLKIPSTVLKDPEGAFKDPECQGLSEIDQEDLPLADTNGKQDYRQLGIDLCKAIWDHDINHKTFMPLQGDWSEEDKKFLYVTRPSDFILSAFVTFQNEDTERSELWGKVIDATISTLQR
ncbi:hypothetical protein BG003_002868 [Podila horticola]|nr:hypothetical protein BG003_002868 [Podila horticola]